MTLGAASWVHKMEKPSEQTTDYHSIKALSAGVAWTMVQECPAQAWWQSPWNPDRVEKQARELDIGTAAHLAVLESHAFAERCSLIAFPDYRAKEARELRDQCYIDGKIPLLPQDYELVTKLRDRLLHSEAHDLLFGDGLNEQEYFWGWDGVSCKAKADRIVKGAIVDLKTASSASPDAFQRAMVRDGHHLRAAWYLDGWGAANDVDIGKDTYELGEEGELIGIASWRRVDYLYVVIAKSEPHLVSIFRLDERTLAWGRTLYHDALRMFRQAQEAEVWPGYGREGEKIIKVQLPAFAENMLIARERAGEFDAGEDDGPSY